MSLKEVFRGREMISSPVRTTLGRWAAGVIIGGRTFYADDGISYILLEEAEKESLNQGRNLIKKGLV